jgi:LuxR family transcriptional regulator, maltose regulon positive regulatory protein
MHLSLGRLLLHGRVARITDEDLALTVEEAHRLLEARGSEPIDVEARWTATGGWVAGVAFGGVDHGSSWARSRDFRSYVSSEVFDQLPAEERQFLLDTSILDAVSLEAAEELCGGELGAVWQRVVNRHLPATTSSDGGLVYHPCFRNYLRDRSELEGQARTQELQSRYASMLLASGHDEEAVELLLSLGHLDAAVAAAEGACRSLAERGDWDTILRWVAALTATRVSASPVLLAAQLRALRGSGRLHDARELTRDLDRRGRLDEIFRSDPNAVVHAAWSLLWHPTEALALLDRHDPESLGAAVRYAVEVISNRLPVVPPENQPAETDRIVSWGLMVQGRIEDLVAMLPSQDEWPPRNPYTTPHPLLGLLWRGEVDRVRALFDQARQHKKRTFHPDMWQYLEAWLLLAEDEPDAALAAAERAVAQSLRTGFGFESVFRVVQGSALLTLGRVDEATSVLEESVASSVEAGTLAYVEWAESFLAVAKLRTGKQEEAAALLRRTVAGMQQADRLLLLPFAAINLAEAERLGGDEAASEAAADIAHGASVRMGAFGPLQQALRCLPALTQELIEREPQQWRRVGAGDAPVARRRVENGSVSVVVSPFGPSPDIIIDGRAASVRRLKQLELVCLLTRHPGGVRRESIQMLLFPDSDRKRGSNYFRQVVHQLRRTTGLTVQRLPNNLIWWSDGIEVDATDLQFERALHEARAVAGDERLDRLRHALALATGPYLPDSELEWAEQRRFELGVLQEDAELEAARLALVASDFELARCCAEATVARNPYAEHAYAILIEIELAVGTGSGALGVYRRAVAALREIQLEPGPELSSLLGHARH